MPAFYSGVLAGLDSVTRQAYEANQIAGMKRNLEVSRFVEQQQEQEKQNKEEQERLRIQAEAEQLGMAGAQPGGPPQVTARPTTPTAGVPGGAGGMPQPPLPGQASQPMMRAFGGGGPPGAPPGVPPGPTGWRPSPSASPALGGMPPGPAGAPGAPQIAPRPKVEDTIPPEMTYKSATEFASYLRKAHPNMPLTQVVKMVEASQPLRDRLNKDAIEELKLQEQIEKEQKAVEDRIRARAIKPGKPTANEREAIIAAHGDPDKPLHEQPQPVQDAVAKTLGGVMGKRSRFKGEGKGGFNPETTGGEVPVKEWKKVGGDSRDAVLEAQAWRLIDYNQYPYRKGKGGPNDPNYAVTQKATEIAKQFGMTVQELSVQSATFKADAQSYAFQTKKLDAIEGTMSSFHNNINTWNSIAEGQTPALGKEEFEKLGQKLKKIDFSDVKTLNDVKLKVQREFGDPAVAAYMVAAATVAVDYARIMQGTQSVASLTEGNRQEAFDLVAAGLAPESRKAIIATLVSDSEGQVKGAKDQLGKIKERMLLKPKSASRTDTDTGSDDDALIAKYRK